jgi:2-polyprenyl-6-methoxyphenol hydroxylase-like FAD-dependent oxidoreductase
VIDDNRTHPTESSAKTATSASPHVLIVGGGLGGLCLAHGLEKAGISVSVHERDRSARFRSQGYRLGVKEAGAHALRDCLPAALFDLCVSTSIRQATRMVFTDEQLEPRFARPVPQITPGLAGFGVNRLTLREILLAGLDDVVQFGKIFERYEHAADGRIRAHFADGSHATGDLLVGADGSNSTVRRLLLPEAMLEDLHWAIYGRTPIIAGTIEEVPDVLVDTFNRVIGPAGATIAVATCRTLEPIADAVARIAPGLRLTPQPDYFSWTMPLIDERYRDADAATLHRLAGDLVAGWHPAVRGLVARAEVPATFQVCVRSARPVEPWNTTNVTLLGDAIHTMSPGRGDGANIALQDAQLLCRALIDVRAGRVRLAQATASYEAEMLRYGFRAVADSLHSPFAPSSTQR